jgi:hypothetical protein
MSVVDALGMLFRELLDREVMDAFEMPSKSAKPTGMSSNDDLQTFYIALENPKYRRCSCS